MLTISKASIGAIAYGRSGVGYPVKEVKGDRLVLRTPNGLKRVPWGAVIQWELPAVPPLNYQFGQRVEVFFLKKNIWRQGYRFLSYSQAWPDRVWLHCPEGHSATCNTNLFRGEQ
ncbi:MAG: hypothetical protein KME35_16090 [Aphanocapsa sp. GSE-SYN-MK-11-07L]|jgi:hypothetical protein|nr:hypothetical protein [Aphanocapsa sp. GSE-SYN-MK-11-07L]